MTPKKLESILCGYLPYGLEIYDTVYKTKIPMTAKGGIVSHGIKDLLDGNNKSLKPILRPLKDLIKSVDGTIPAYDMAIIADCHFKEHMQVDDYKFFEEDNCYVVRVIWSDKRNDYFEISWGMDLFDVDERNDDFIMTLGEGGAVHNVFNILQVLFKHKFDIFRLIERGKAIDINTL